MFAGLEREGSADPNAIQRIFPGERGRGIALKEMRSFNLYDSQQLLRRRRENARIPDISTLAEARLMVLSIPTYIVGYVEAIDHTVIIDPHKQSPNLVHDRDDQIILKTIGETRKDTLYTVITDGSIYTHLAYDDGTACASSSAGAIMHIRPGEKSIAFYQPKPAIRIVLIGMQAFDNQDIGIGGFTIKYFNNFWDRT